MSSVSDYVTRFGRNNTSSYLQRRVLSRRFGLPMLRLRHRHAGATALVERFRPSAGGCRRAQRDERFVAEGRLSSGIETERVRSSSKVGSQVAFPAMSAI